MSAFKRVVLGVKTRIADDRLTLVAGGVAFFAFLSVFPALATVISIYGLVADPQTVQSHISSLGGAVPREVQEVISSRLESLVSSRDSSLTIGFAFGLLVSLWSANKAMKAIADALNIAVDVEEDRGFVKRNAVTLLLTLVSSLVFIVALAVIVIVPVLVSTFLSQGTAKILTTVVSWIVFIGLLVGMFLVLYRYAPARHRRQPWNALLPGAIFSGVLFVVTSAAFSFYVGNFGKYELQYGALGAVVVMMLWLFIGAYVFLLGAEINAERNHPELRQSRRAKSI
ncbi:MAG: YihY/virulence factor BrkB family protein [Proteobacteria bacterium]|nr:YihY/virulence factor BrkB family protein [Pseudomonadota bacterium]